MSFSSACFQHTPALTVTDGRGLAVRAVAFLRHPDTPDACDLRVTRHHHDPRGFLSRSADPRLHGTGLANFTWRHALSGTVLRAQGVDNGTAVTLSDAAGRPFIAVCNIRTAKDGTDDLSQAVTRTWQYEDATLPGRPVSITEQLSGAAPRVAERFLYAGSTAAEQGLNLAGACVSHYDTAGLLQTDSVALTGVPLSVTRRLLKEADSPDAVAGWQGEDIPAWNGLLADGAHTTLTTADAAGAVTGTTDAKGNRQRVAYDVAGRVSGRWLTVKGGKEQVIVRALAYSAAGQTLREVHGNGVVTTYTYEPQTQRLTGIKTERPAGHASGARVLQDLRYGYDPAGNVLSVRDDAEQTRFWRNQKVAAESTYAYDSLYRLVRATGREMANAGQGSSLPSATVPLPADGAAYTNYTRTYTYDAGDNLTQIRHHAPATDNTYTTNITLSDRSNRGVLSTLTDIPSGVDGLFTAGGQQTQLQPGQALAWTPRNELQAVTPVVRDGDRDDRESYRYDAQSRRVLKVSVRKAGGSVQTQRVVYLPGLELRSTQRGGAETECLQVMTAGEAGRAQVRVLHWTSGRPADLPGDRVRYSHDTLTGSSGLEVDGEGRVISREEYYPYGGTAVLTARSAAEARDKILRYSGKERDATGLYYYGYRYYQPWSGRWLSADPAGTVDGLNLFRMCRNNPVTLKDEDGRASYTELELQKVRNDIAKGTYSDHHRRYFEEEALGSRQTAQVELERAAVDSLPYIHSDEDGVLYRGVSMPSDELKRLHAGGTIQNSQLSFFSSSRAVARSFATLQNQVAGNVPVIFKIRGIPSGIFHKGLKGGAAYASMFDMFGLNGLSRNAMREEISASTEAVLPPGHMFSITSIKHGDSSITSFKRAWTGFKASVPAFLGTRMTRLRHRLNIGSYQNRVAPLMASKERAHKIAGTMFTTHMTPGKLSFADPVKNVTRITISYSGYSQRKNITATSHFL